MSQNNIQIVAAYFFSAGLCAAGLRTLYDPVAQAEVYGIPVSPKDIEWVPVMGARNLALGISLGALMYQGNKRAAGTVLASALAVGIIDTWVTAKHAGKMSGAAWSHVIGDGIASLLGFWMALT